MAAALRTEQPGFAPDVWRGVGMWWCPLSREDATGLAASTALPSPFKSQCAVAGELATPQDGWPPSGALPHVWWTPWTKPQVWASGRWRHLRPSNWLGEEWDAWQVRWGLAPETAKEWMAPCSSALTRALVSLLRLYRQEEAGWHPGEGSFSEDVRARWPQPLPGVTDLAPLIRETQSPHHRWEWPASVLTGKRQVRLLCPAKALWRTVGSTAVPSGAWTAIQAWPETQSERWSWVLRQTRPLLVQAEAFQWKMEHEAQGQRWLGMRGRSFPGMMPGALWLTNDELEDVEKWGSCVCVAAYQAEGWSNAWSTWMEEDVGEMASSPLLEHTPSRQLWWAVRWDALMNARRHPHTREAWDDQPARLWHQAAERRALGRVAAVFSEHHLAVLEYGQGGITIALDPAMDVPAFAAACYQAGVWLPAAVAHHVPLDEKADPENPLAVQHWLHKHPHALWDLDRLGLLWPGPTDRPVLERATQRLLDLPAPHAAWQTWWKEALTRQARAAVKAIREERSVTRT